MSIPFVDLLIGILVGNWKNHIFSKNGEGGQTKCSIYQRTHDVQRMQIHIIGHYQWLQFSAKIS